MRAGDVLELNTFVAVAEEGRFAKAAARLGVTPSGVSRSIRKLEARLGARLFARTTRSVALTEAGEALLREAKPALDRLRRAESAVAPLAQAVSGRVRLSAPLVATELLLAPILPTFRSAHPGLRLEISVDDRLIDLVAGRFDASIRRGGLLEQDMIARRLSPDDQLILVASPSYLGRSPPLATPRDLFRHERISIRRPRSGANLPWRLRSGEVEAQVGASASITTDDAGAARRCAVAGLGIALLASAFVAEEIAADALRQTLPQWPWPIAGFHLAYLERGALAPALVELERAIKLRLAKKAP